MTKTEGVTDMPEEIWVSSDPDCYYWDLEEIDGETRYIRADPSTRASDGWQGIESRPREGKFMAWRPSAGGPCVVINSAVDGMVCEPISGKTWIAFWWKPIDAPPTPDAGDRDGE